MHYLAKAIRDLVPFILTGNSNAGFRALVNGIVGSLLFLYSNPIIKLGFVCFIFIKY